MPFSVSLTELVLIGVISTITGTIILINRIKKKPRKQPPESIMKPTTVQSSPQNQVITDRTIFNLVRKDLKRIIYRSFAIGMVFALVTALIVPIYLLTQTQNTGTPLNDENNENGFPLNFAESLTQAIPQVEYIEIVGNGTGVICENLLTAYIYRAGSINELLWNVTAEYLAYDEYNRTIVRIVNFILNADNISQISDALYTSINNTEFLGTYGEEPYNSLDINIKWGLVFYLENHTLIDILVLENGWIIADIGTWVSYDFTDTNLLGAAVLGTESAFNPLLDTLGNIFHKYSQLQGCK